jgi:Rieske 2Fe-2S family protein
MGVTAPWHDDDGYADLNHVIETLPQAELKTLWSLGDSPEAPLPRDRAFGEETDNPLNQAQMRWLELRHGVYFPWKTCFHFINNERWADKHDAREFSAEVIARFPMTVAMLRSLPFVHIGRAVLFGVHPNDHAPYHRDSEPGVTESVPHSLSVHPDPNKQLWLASADGRERRAVDARVFWFNDMDYHGVEPAPVFRYSIRVDGKFDPAWLRALAQRRR